VPFDPPSIEKITMPVLNTNEIKNLLPHRYPFLLIDRVLDYELNKTLKAVKNITVNEPYFQGHFPVKPVMPGVLIIEALAQAAAILGSLSLAGTLEVEPLYFLVGVDNARFRQTVEPGDQLIINVDFLSVRRKIWKFYTCATVSYKKVASAEILTTIVDP
jgi:3-hydroxyacyl-[acyl-carrier-protein] dehydratase